MWLMSSQGQSNGCQGLDPSSTVKKLRDIHENISIDDILERESRIIKYHEMSNYVCIYIYIIIINIACVTWNQLVIMFASKKRL